jgi:hypothetical protein
MAYISEDIEACGANTNLDAWKRHTSAESHRDKASVGPDSSSASEYTYYQSTHIKYHRCSTTWTSQMESSSYSNMAHGDVTFSPGEIAELRERRRQNLRYRFLEHGTPLPQSQSQQINHEEVRTSSFQTAFMQETAFASGTTQQSGRATEQDRQPKHGATFWAAAISRITGDFLQVPLIGDTGSKKNWITKSLADKLQCVLDDVEPNIIFTDFGGGRHVARKKATISLDGKGRTAEDIEFYIAPESTPIQGAIIGSDFMNETGDPSIFFPTEPEEMVQVIVQSKVLVSGLITIENQIANVQKESEKQTIKTNGSSTEATAAVLTEKRESKRKSRDKTKASVIPTTGYRKRT